MTAHLTVPGSRGLFSSTTRVAIRVANARILLIAAGAPLVARWHKRFIRRLCPPQQLSADDWSEGFACFDTADYREGLRAFLNKQVPHFSGR